MLNGALPFKECKLTHCTLKYIEIWFIYLNYECPFLQNFAPLFIRSSDYICDLKNANERVPA